jgi:hypothetical protein
MTRCKGCSEAVKNDGLAEVHLNLNLKGVRAYLDASKDKDELVEIMGDLDIIKDEALMLKIDVKDSLRNLGFEVVNSMELENNQRFEFVMETQKWRDVETGREVIPE